MKSDRCLKNEGPYNTPNLGHELIEHDYTFRGYSESIPKNGFKGCDIGKSRYPNGGYLYGRFHNPWVDWQRNTPAGLPANTNFLVNKLPDKFDNLLTVAIVVPNKDDDMHNGPDSLTIKRADDWLKKIEKDSSCEPGLMQIRMKRGKIITRPGRQQKVAGLKL